MQIESDPSCTETQISIRPLTSEVNFDFFGKEEMVDLLFETMTHSAVKSGLINAVLLVLRAYTWWSIYTDYFFYIHKQN